MPKKEPSEREYFYHISKITMTPQRFQLYNARTQYHWDSIIFLSFFHFINALNGLLTILNYFTFSSPLHLLMNISFERGKDENRTDHDAFISKTERQTRNSHAFWLILEHRLWSCAAELSRKVAWPARLLSRGESKETTQIVFRLCDMNEHRKNIIFTIVNLSL